MSSYAGGDMVKQYRAQVTDFTPLEPIAFDI